MKSVALKDYPTVKDANIRFMLLQKSLGLRQWYPS